MVDRPTRCTTLLLALLAGCGGGGSSVPEPAPAPPPTAPAPPPEAVGLPAGYRLVWSDEFEVDGLPNAARWGYDTERNRLGWYNNELQYYSAERLENTAVSGGRLRITARQERLTSAADWGGQRYTSTRLITRGKAQWTYGFFEVRAKLPCGRGTWPAIWMLGSGGKWPDDGEIDIMEQVGSNPSRILGTLHTPTTGGSGNSGNTQVPDACTAFHNYQMHWTPSAISFAVDGNVYHRVPNPGTGRPAWPFNAPQYMLLNVAIGGTLGGSVDDSIFPVTMEIDHVRVWQAP